MRQKAESLIRMALVFNRQLEDVAVEAMLELLEDMSDEEIDKACRRASQSSKFMPTIADIRELVAEARLASSRKVTGSVMVGKIDTRAKELALCEQSDRDDLGMTSVEYELYKREEEQRTGEPYLPPGFHPKMWNDDGSPKD